MEATVDTSKNRYAAVADTLREVNSQTTPLPHRANVLQRLSAEVSSVVRYSLNNWQHAYEDAIDPLRYDREELLGLYEQIEIDEHVTALVDTVYNNSIANDFQIVNQAGEQDVKAKQLFDRPWFSEFVALCLDATFHGFNGLQFTGVSQGSYSGVKLIPRQHILPFEKGIRFHPNTCAPDLLFEDKTIANWTAFIFPQLPGDQYRLGKFNKIAKLFILKRENMQFWAMFNEIFGIPFRVLKTDLRDKTKMDNAISAMKSMTAAAYSVIHDEDEIIFHNGVAAANTSTFKDFLAYANKGMSKALVGSTMVLEDGSSRSQGEVHERNTSAFVVSYQRRIAQWINELVIPKMHALGMAISPEHRFKWDNTETLSKSQVVDVIARLTTAGYQVPVDYVTEHTGIPVEKGLPPLSPPKEGTKQGVPGEPPSPGQGQNGTLYKRLVGLYGKYVGKKIFQRQLNSQKKDG